MGPLSLGFSPCPNDTFIFHALVHGLIPGSPPFRERLEDVETLNSLVLADELDVSKISFHLLGHIRDRYVLLRSGGALGRGCGPLVVTRDLESADQLAGKRIAIPGRYTTAALLLRLYNPSFSDLLLLPFHEIMPAVASGRVDAGVIIHESRFTYQSHGLRHLIDLGAWWEKETGCPIPLGGIVARRSLGDEMLQRVQSAIRSSVAHAFDHPSDSRSYCRQHAQEMDDRVLESHIGLYVNPFSLDVGEEGERAIAVLLQRGEAAGLFPSSPDPHFLPAIPLH
jgi:1,4-dihydroxy-6-naphthoate synthase